MSCPKCKEGFVLPGEPTGTIEKDFEGAYFAPALVEESSKHVIIFLTDGFGLPLNNCKLMADNLAKRLACDVWVPDYFKGQPLVAINDLRAPDRAGVKMSVMDWVKFILFSGIPSLPAFIRSRPSVADQRVTTFINLLKEKKDYKKLGVVGYCYGGATAVRLAGTDIVHSAVICHPGPFSMAQVNSIKVPTSWVCAEEDIFVPDSLRLSAEASLAQRKGQDSFVEYEFKVYKGTAHGFAARPNLNLPEIKEAHEQAFEQTVSWFQKTLLG
ncbi:dienelactone hydrolase endo-1,3,1,4-beta-D-glucanase [Crassisporium funariophilum]|nr:dienelactone hydrolase endo-1,3,1,4-beta-D-glucanase [Crassisporium funariophilum]